MSNHVSNIYILIKQIDLINDLFLDVETFGSQVTKSGLLCYLFVLLC